MGYTQVTDNTDFGVSYCFYYVFSYLSLSVPIDTLRRPFTAPVFQILVHFLPFVASPCIFANSILTRPTLFTMT